MRERALTFPHSEGALRLESAVQSPQDLARRVTRWLRESPASIGRDRWVDAGKA